MVRTRIAPSPTGEELHIGNLYTALINFAWAKKHNGRFIVRIEDTDRKRYNPDSEKKILRNLKDFGIVYDEGPDVGGDFGPYRQSERLQIYRKYIDILIKKKIAYPCFCSPERLSEIRRRQLKEKKTPPKYDRYCLNLPAKEAVERFRRGEPSVIRLKIPENQIIKVKDEIRGEIEFDSNLIDDQILLKSDGFPTYHFAVVVDDYLMKIDWVIRAEEWISSLPKHILLYQAFGWELPRFVHLPILRNPDRSKLSKRKNPVWASWYLEQGFLPEAVLNYLALMGWSHPEGKEKFSLEEFIEVFEIRRIKPVGPVFDVRKLEWLNGEYLREKDKKTLTCLILKYYKKYKNLKLDPILVEKTIPLIKERVKKLSDYLFYCQFFFERPRQYQLDLSRYKDVLTKIYDVLKEIPEKRWTASEMAKSLSDLADGLEMSRSKFFMVLRVAITGVKITPPLNESMEILGKEECLQRIKTAKILKKEP